ncbi:MAG: hypothetical protein KBT07_05730 [Clostridiales bacterium]|nr:hypothetical protein [Candidatus Scatonaster coprocaballi]
MTDWIMIAVTLAAGLLLCFYGFKMFRISVAVAGFYVGKMLGDLLYGILADQFPSSWNGKAADILPIVTAVILAVISYAIYRKALCFLTSAFTAFTIMKIFVVYLVKTEENLDLLIKFSPETIEKIRNTSTGGETLISEAEVGNILTQIPGEAGWQKLLLILIFSLALGTLAGVLIMLIQAPAIKIATSVIGADAIRIALMDTVDQVMLVKGLPSFLSTWFGKAQGNVWVSFFLWALFIGLGCAVQLRESDG